MAAIQNDDVIATSCDVTITFRGRQRKQFLTYYLPTMSHCHSFNALDVLKGVGILRPPPLHPPGLGTKKKPRLNRVKKM